MSTKVIKIVTYPDPHPSYLEVISYFLSCFDPPHQNTPFELVIVDSEVNVHCYV